MDFSGKIAINKGWSDDKKYCVTDQKQQKYFLRVSDKEKLDSKKFEFDMMEKVASLGVPMCKPISIELCDDEVHSLHEWIDRWERCSRNHFNCFERTTIYLWSRSRKNPSKNSFTLCYRSL